MNISVHHGDMCFAFCYSFVGCNSQRCKEVDCSKFKDGFEAIYRLGAGHVATSTERTP